MGTTTGIPCERGRPDVFRMTRLLKGQSGGKRRVCGASGHPEPAREPPQEKKRLLNSPGHSVVLSPNLLQSFSREVGSFRWFSGRLREPPLACACFPPELLRLPAAQERERARARHSVCLRAPGRQRNPGGRGGSGAVFGSERGARRSKHPLGASRGRRRRLGRPSDRTSCAVGSQPHSTPTRRRPHCGCRLCFSGGLGLAGTGSVSPPARVFLGAGPRHALPRWQAAASVTGSLPGRVHCESLLNQVSSLSSRQSLP